MDLSTIISAVQQLDDEGFTRLCEEVDREAYRRSRGRLFEARSEIRRILQKYNVTLYEALPPTYKGRLNKGVVQNLDGL